MRDQSGPWEADGIVVRDGLVRPEELAPLRALAEDLLERLAASGDAELRELGGIVGRDGLRHVPQVLAPQRWSPALAASPFVARAARWARSVLGRDARTDVAMLVAKPPSSDGSGVVPWHQDAAYWPRGTVGASVWVPLQDVDARNGALQVVLGSHRGEVLEHRPLGGDPAVHTLELPPSLVDRHVVDPVVVPLRAGQASLHHGRLLHHTGPNDSPSTRLAVVLSVRVPVPVRGPSTTDGSERLTASAAP